MLGLTGRLMRFEREDARQLKKLAKRLDPVRDTTLWHLMVTMMQIDTAKHLLMLRFLQDRARGSST